MGMAYCETDKARIEVDKLVSINILYDASLTRVRSEWVEYNERRRDQRLVLFEQGSGVWTWTSNHHLRLFRRCYRRSRAHLSATNKIAQIIRPMLGKDSESNHDSGE